MTRWAGSRRQPVFVALTVILVWAVCESIIAVALGTQHPPANTMDPRAFIEPHRTRIQSLIDGKTGFVAFDPTLGWSHKPWGRGGIYRANGQGLRADGDYSLSPSPGVYRVATFGDSFMLGADVEVEKTWQAVIEDENPTVEVLNFGVSSYGTDQAVLRYLNEGRAFHPDVVVLSMIAENARRNTSTFRPFYLPSTGLPLSKPRYRLADGKLVLVENPIQSLDQYRELLEHPEIEFPRIGRWDVYYQQFKPSTTPLIDNFPSVQAARFWFGRWREWWSDRRGRSRAVADWYKPGGGRNPLLFKIFDRFHDQAVSDGAKPVFLFFPIHFDYADAGVDGPMPYDAWLPFLDAKGYRYLDFAEVFRPYLASHPWADLYALGSKGGHYSATAHRLIANAMEATIDDLRREEDGGAGSSTQTR